MDRVEFITELGLTQGDNAHLVIKYFDELMAFYNIVVNHLSDNQKVNFNMRENDVNINVQFVDKNGNEKKNIMKERLHRMSPILTIYGLDYHMEIEDYGDECIPPTIRISLKQI